MKQHWSWRPGGMLEPEKLGVSMFDFNWCIGDVPHPRFALGPGANQWFVKRMV